MTAQKSSWTGGPGRRALLRLGFPNALNQPLVDAIGHAVRSAIASPLPRASSVPEFGVVLVRVEQRVRAIRLRDLGWC